MHPFRVVLAAISVFAIATSSLSGASVPPSYPKKAAEYAVAFATQNPAPAKLDDSAAQDLFLKDTPFEKNSKFSGLFKQAVAVVQTLKSDQTTITAGDSDIIDVIVDSLPSTGNPAARVAKAPTEPAGAPATGSKDKKETAASEVRLTDAEAYKLLQAKAVVLNSKLKDATDKSKDAKASAAEKKDAETKASKLTLDLKSNQADQAVLQAQAKVDAAQTAADAAKGSDQAKAKTTLAEAGTNLKVVQDGSDALKRLKLQAAEPTGNFRNLQAYFHTGFALLNPYKITDANKDDPANHHLVIQNTESTDIAAVFEFRYSNRWAWNTEKVMRDFPDRENPREASIFGGPFTTHLDVETRLGYTFASSAKASASTLVGSGDFNGEVSVGMPLWLWRSPNDGARFTVGPVGSFSTVTDRAFLKPHNRFLGGLSYSTAFDDPFGAADSDRQVRKVLLDFRAGRAHIDSVNYALDANGHLFSDGKIDATETFQPIFHGQKAWAFEAQLLYPINASSFLIFDGRVYSDVKPGQWNLQIGFTTSLQDFVNSFSK